MVLGSFLLVKFEVNTVGELDNQNGVFQNGNSNCIHAVFMFYKYLVGFCQL